jgi:hypothetical protein
MILFSLWRSIYNGGVNEVPGENHRSLVRHCEVPGENHRSVVRHCEVPGENHRSVVRHVEDKPKL